MFAVRSLFRCRRRGDKTKKGIPVLLAACRPIVLVLMSIAAFSSGARAAPALIEFTAMIGPGNAIDTGNVFGEGYGADLAGQIITGSIVIDAASLRQRCGVGGACYTDQGAGAVSVGFTLNGVTVTAVSTGTLGYAGNSSGGLVQINDPAHGGDNYLAVGATSTNGTMQASVGALFSAATVFSAYGGGSPTVAIDSLSSIAAGSGLIAGGITLLSPIEHLDATILTIEAAGIPEPFGLGVLGVALAGLGWVRRRSAR